MHHSLRILGLGVALALAGTALIVFTLRKSAPPAAGKAVVPKKSELREREALQAAQAAESKKLRIVGTLCVLAGATLMILS